MGLELQAAEFDLAHRGFWQGAYTTVEVAFVDRFSFGLEIPVANIDYSDGSSALGVGDVAVATRFLIVSDASGRLFLSGMLGLELPTGNEAEGLGDGHFMLTPMLAATFRPVTPLAITLALSDHFGPEGSRPAGAAAAPLSTVQHAGGHTPAPQETAEEPVDDGTHGSVLSPHSPHEGRIALNTVYAWDLLYVAAGAEVVVMFAEDDVLGPVTVAGGAGVTPTKEWRVGVQLAGPVAGQERLLWRGALSMEYLF